MGSPLIEGIRVRVSLDDHDEALADAHQRADDGEQDMTEWIDSFHRGHALVVRTVVTATVRRGDESFAVTVENHGIWTEAAEHPATTAGGLQETAYKDLQPLAAALGEAGVDVSPGALGDMHFAVELDEDLLAKLGRRPRLVEPAEPRVAERD